VSAAAPWVNLSALGSECGTAWRALLPELFDDSVGKRCRSSPRLPLKTTDGTPEKGWNKWVLKEEQSRPFIQKALELGINFFDTANVYSEGASEEVLGRALRDFTKRDEVMVATKVYATMRKDPNGKGLSRKATMTEVDGSLRRLGMDYIDLYQIHRWDYETPIKETLEDAVKALSVKLSDEEIKSLEEPYIPHPLVGFE
jgi:aryl-alcohol dehydrogenase-like predicted oxidoreductase